MLEIGPGEKVYSVFKIAKIFDCQKAEGVPLQAGRRDDGYVCEAEGP